MWYLLSALKCINILISNFLPLHIIATNHPRTGCPRVAKKLHNLFVIKDINFFFILDDSYASTAYSENIAVYLQSVPIL
jgi:hypothetical protein